MQQGRSRYLFPEFSSDVTKPLDSIKAHGFQTSIPKHLYHLSIFWTTWREGGRIRLEGSVTDNEQSLLLVNYNFECPTFKTNGFR